MHVGDFVDVHVVVNVCDIDDIHRGVRHVDVLHVARARAVRRNVHFTRAQREPRDSSTPTAERHRHAEPRAADENHQSRRVHGPHHYGTRHPAPASADFRPAAIVKWSKAPGFVFHPGPTPRCDPNPMSVAVRRPSDGDTRGEPHISIIGGVSPLAIVIEVVIADNVARDVAGGLGVLFAIVAAAAPGVKFVATAGSPAVIGQRVRAAESCAVAGVHVVVGAAAGGFTFSGAHGNRRRVAVGIDIDAVFAGALQREGQIWRVDFIGVATIEPAHEHVHRALRQLNLHGAIVKIQECNSCLAADANRGAADMQFTPRVSVGPQIVTHGERAIGIRLHPIRFTARLEGDRSLDVVEACHSSRRIIVRECGRRIGKDKTRKNNQNWKKEPRFSHSFCASDLHNIENWASILILLSDRKPCSQSREIQPILHS